MQLSILTIFALCASSVISAPISYRQSLVKRAVITQIPYNQFQISDTPTGNALAEAQKVFTDPLAGRDLSTVTADELKALNGMARAAVDAEDVFNSAISAATGAEATQLQNGKLKNKVLKLLGEVTVLQIKQAQGQNVASDLATEQGKLDKDTAADAANPNQTSKGVSFTADDAGTGTAVNGTGSTTTTTTADSTNGQTATSTNEAATAVITQIPYNQFQISDTPTGNALAEAQKVFTDPLAGRDLSTVTADELKALNGMARAAVDAEDVFNSAISAATGAEATQLQNGKLKNKVLKLLGEVTVLQIKQAQGQNVASDLATEQGKLDKDTAADAANPNQTSKGVSFTADDA